MSRLLAIGDVHGCYDKLVKLLDIISYNSKEDQLVLLGDYIDRGDKSKETIELVMKLVNNGAIALKGNHEDMFLNSIINPSNIYGKDDFNIWFYNGGNKTLENYKVDGKVLIPEEHMEFIKNLPEWYETEDYIFVHAGLSVNKTSPSESLSFDLMWIRDEWIYSRYNGKKVIFGHTPTQNISNKNKPWFGKNKICIDTGAVFPNGKLTCLQLPEMNYWQV